MRRVVVLGPPGSGKSTLARELGARLAVPVFHLDQAYWRPGWVETPAAAFKAEIERLAGLPAWVIEGNYTDTIAVRFATADIVVYLDIPSWLLLFRVVRRIVRDYGRVRADASPGCPERLDIAFLRYVWSWNRIRRARTLMLVESYVGRKVVLRTSADWHQFVAGIGRSKAI